MKLLSAGARRCSFVALTCIAASLTACGGDDDGTAVAQPTSTVPSADQLKTACPSLAGQVVPAAAIGLPSGAGTVVTATFVAAVAAVEYRNRDDAGCARLLPRARHDRAGRPGRAADQLRAQPADDLERQGAAVRRRWLQRHADHRLAALRDAAPDDVLPITRGYATLGTDSGHQSSAFAANNVGQFGLNDEMLANYGYASYKKVRDVSVALMKTFYAQAPGKVYYFGGSEGGREGLTMAQRFPADYDGIVSVVPVVQLSMLFQSYIPHVVPQFTGGWLNPAKVRTLATYVANACDALDGLADGVVNNYLACPARVNLQGLRCAAGADTGDTCLSDPQIAVVASVHAPYTFAFPLANGLSTYPQWFYGNETTPDPTNPTMVRWVTGTAAPTVPVDAATASTQWLYGNNFVRFFIARDAGFDARTYRPTDFMARVQAVSAIIDSTNPDLSAFFGHGGKLIVRENMGDLAQSPIAGISYFSSVAAKVGQSTMDQSARLYVSPASTHTGQAASVTDGTAVATMVDLLDPLDRWVTTGQAPADPIVQTVKAAVPPFTLQASRPMCRYPNYPRFTGNDRTQASSYTCVLSTP